MFKRPSTLEALDGGPTLDGETKNQKVTRQTGRLEKPVAREKQTNVSCDAVNSCYR